MPLRESETPVSSPLPRSQKRAVNAKASESNIESSSLDQYNAGETERIALVRQRCNAQNEALSLWWKAAIQAYIQQRMWMQLGRNTSESMLPPRFERLYQPDKFAHFDRIFARSWATPVRSSHSSQHSTSVEEESEIMEYRRNISGRVASAKEPERLKLHAALPSAKENDEAGEDEMTIQSFVGTYGMKPRVAPTLTRFIKPHENIKGRPRSPTRMGKCARILFHMATTVADPFVLVHHLQQERRVVPPIVCMSGALVRMRSHQVSICNMLALNLGNPTEEKQSLSSENAFVIRPWTRMT